MSDITQDPGADGTRESAGAPSGDEIRDEVRLHLDEERLDTWDDVRGDYAVDPESDMARPALTESEDDDENDLASTSEDDEEDAEAEDDGDEGTDEEE